MRATLPCLIIYLAVCSHGIDITMDSGVSQSSVDLFVRDVNGMLASLKFSWTDTVLYPELTHTFLASADTFPSYKAYNKFVGGSIFWSAWNANGALSSIQYMSNIPNSERESFEAKMRSQVVSTFQIYTNINGVKVRRPTNASDTYYPITYCSPCGTKILGLDVNDDVEGPCISKAMTTGLPSSAEPYDARSASVEFEGFNKLMSIYFPLFIVNGTFQQTQASKFGGTVTAVLAFHPFLVSLLKSFDLKNIDVFMFRVQNVSGSLVSSYMAHYESGPNQTKPGITPDQANNIQPSDIVGDIVTTFTSSYDMVLFDKTFRLLVRLRKGAATKDVLIFCSSGTGNKQNCSKMNKCCASQQRNPVQIFVQNYDSRMVTFNIIGPEGKDPGNPCNGSEKGCNFTLGFNVRGIYIVSVFLDGEQVANSPILVEVASRQCAGPFEADENGLCVCPVGMFQITDSCARYDVVVPAIVVPTVAALALIGLALYCRSKATRQQVQWKIDEDELEFHDSGPADAMFKGLVYKANFRGTPVAVKRLPVLSSRSTHLEASDDEVNIVLTRVNSDSSITPESTDHNVQRLSRTMSLSRTLSHSSNTSVRLKRQIISMVSTRHPNLATVMGVAQVSHESLSGQVLVMEFVEFGSLSDLLANPTFPLRAEDALRMLNDVARGMQFLHESSPPMFHGHLKSSNILVDRAFVARISEFGLVTHYNDKCYSPWLAPECFRGGAASPAADTWAFGVIACEVLTRRPPYDDFGEPMLYKWIMNGDVRPLVPPACSTEIKALVNDCFKFEPAQRAPFAELNRRLAAMDPHLLDSPGVFEPLEDARQSKGAPKLNLPQYALDALAAGDKVPPEPKPMVSILFSDIAGFTTMSSELSAEKVSGMLERLFDKLDQLAVKHSIFKVETIGDAYICATNVVVDQDNDHAALLARFALGATSAASSTLIDEDDPARGCVPLRVGLHSGPCMACVVGRLNPKYTLLGDTVNVASRMESTSLPGRAQCSERFARLLLSQDRGARLQARGTVEVKGKGGMATFWLLQEGEEPDPLDGGELFRRDSNVSELPPIPSTPKSSSAIPGFEFLHHCSSKELQRNPPVAARVKASAALSFQDLRSIVHRPKPL